MKTRHSLLTHSSRQKGSALMTAIFFIAILFILATSMISYSLSEQRGNERNRLILRAKNMAENISIYAAEQLSVKLYRMGSAPSGRKFPYTGTSRNRVYMPPDSTLNTGFTSAATGMEMRTGILTASPYTVVTDSTDPNYNLYVSTAKIPIIAKATANLPALGSVSAYVEQDMSLALTPLFQFGIFYNMDLELFPGQNMEIIGPVHTNGKLMARGEVGGSAAISFRGRVSAAEGLYADGQIKANYVKRDGSNNNGAGGSGAVNYSAINGTLINLYNSSIWKDQKFGTATETSTTQASFWNFTVNNYSSNLRTNVHGVTKLELPAIGTYKEKDDASTPLEDERNNGRQIIEPPNTSKYTAGAWSATTDNSEIQQSKISWRAGLYIVVNPDDLVRTATLPNGITINVLPRTYRCWLNTIETSGSHTMVEVVLPGQPGYGYNDNGTPSNTADDFMYVNNLPNKYTNDTVMGYNQVLRISRAGYDRIKRYNGSSWINTVTGAVGTTGALPDDSGYALTGGSNYAFPAENSTTPYPAEAFFFDLRRANGNSGYDSLIAGGTNTRSSVNYVPRPIAKIDFDMTRFKMTVDRTMSATVNAWDATALTSTVYDVGIPTATNWANSIYNGSTSTPSVPTAKALGTGLLYAVLPTALTLTAADPYRMYFAPTDPLASNITSNPGAYGVGGASLYSASAACPWYDGIAIYLHSVDAEKRSQTSGVPDRVDSGVRLWNGRGPIVSLSASGKTGLTFVTNDAAYIIGHYNANGMVNSTTSSSGNGGYSARYPDSSSEKLCAVMADAITLLSQPVYTSSSGNYYQYLGWSDALSAFRVTNASWVNTWRNSAPTGSNSFDGLGTSATAIKPGTMPNNNTPGSYGTAMQTKLPTVNTEFSTALLMGMVPSNHNATGLTDGPPKAAANAAYSGGAHNFPRLLEDWHNDLGPASGLGSDTQGLFIRGSMVALFESRVAMEPYSMRTYQAPTRYWGLHEGFVSDHDLPLEPIVLSSTREGFRELTAAQYADMKTTIEALTALP